MLSIQRQEILIQDDLQTTIEYIVGAILFVIDLARNTKATSCPFHLDVLIAYPNARKISEDEEMEQDEEDM